MGVRVGCDVGEGVVGAGGEEEAVISVRIGGYVRERIVGAGDEVEAVIEIPHNTVPYGIVIGTCGGTRQVYPVICPRVIPVYSPPRAVEAPVIIIVPTGTCPATDKAKTLVFSAVYR